MDVLLTQWLESFHKVYVYHHIMLFKYITNFICQL